MTEQTDAALHPAKRTFHLGPSGGHGGKAFELLTPPGVQPTGLLIYHAEMIDGLGLMWPGQNEAQMAGGDGGTLSVVKFGAGETLVRIRGRHGAHLDHLELTSSTGEVMTFGGDGGTHQFSYDVPPGSALAGLFGRAGTFIDALGIIVVPDAQNSAGKAAPGVTGNPELTTQPRKSRVRTAADAPATPVKRQAVKKTAPAEPAVDAPVKKRAAPRASRKVTE